PWRATIVDHPVKYRTDVCGPVGSLFDRIRHQTLGGGVELGEVFLGDYAAGQAVLDEAGAAVGGDVTGPAVQAPDTGLGELLADLVELLVELALRPADP